MPSRSAFLAFALAMSSFLLGCGDNIEPPQRPGGPDPEPPFTEPTQTTRVCAELAPITTGLCEVTPGDANRLIKGTVLTPGITYVGGQVAFNEAGTITCVGCDCAANGATVITCPQGVISPGLINAHDHSTYAQNRPVPAITERFEHRHDWRSGLRGHTAVDVPGSASNDAISFGELRFVFGGGTSVNGSGGRPGLLRNLDRDTLLEGLEQTPIYYQTFPLGDSGQSIQRRSTCNYGSGDTTDEIASEEAYTPHISEGIDQASRNEFLCASSETYDIASPGLSTDLLAPQTAIIHGTGLLATDFAMMFARKTALIWSPRTNVSLYGTTAEVPTAHRMGVQVALGTDWIATGSTNMLRELKCADELNRDYYNGYLPDVALWKMATVNAAAAVAMDDAIGVLAPNTTADISIFDGRTNKEFRAVIDAEPKNVALVLRGGKPLYGDDTLVNSLTADAGAGCDAVDVCSTAKKVCLMAEVGKTWTQLTAALPTAYPAFYCGAPADEPTCKPSRGASVNDSTIFTGDKTATDKDGDGIPDASDNCADVFNPVRPLDDGRQLDTDGDGRGDVCDNCPLGVDGDKCLEWTEEDRDADGVANTEDNCPMITNKDQKDGDADGKGDVCDDCAASANAGDMPCPATIYAVKKGTTPVDAIVRITNALVTGKGSNGFFIQVKETDPGYTNADFSGLFVFTQQAAYLEAAEVGARVNLEGQMTNFFGQLEVANVSTVTRVGTTTELPPAPTPATIGEIGVGGSRAAALEAVIVTTGTSTVTAVNTSAGEFTATAAALNLIVDDFLFVNPNAPGVAQSYATLTGILAYRNNAPKLEPRSASDLNPIARLASVSTTPAFIRFDSVAATTFPAPLTVRLTMPVATDTFVAIASSDTGSATVENGGVTIPAGQVSAPIRLTGVTAAASVTLTATLDAQTFTTTVRVLGAAEVPTTLSLTPEAPTVVPGGNVTFTVTLDLPAAAPVEVTLSASPATGTLPATITIPVNQLAATAVFSGIQTSTTVTATSALGTDTAQVTVQSTVGGLVINEVDYDQPGTDTGEYLELYNAGTTPVSLANLVVVFVNGSNLVASPEYKRSDISAANGGTLPAGAYLVLAKPDTVVAPGAILYTPPGWTTTDMQNGGTTTSPSADGVAILNTMTGVFLDKLSYEGSVTAAVIMGVTGTVNLVEGTAATAADTGVGAASMCRLPNGSDANNADADWKVCALTPGAANAAAM
jgi:large repetitive protein